MIGKIGTITLVSAITTSCSLAQTKAGRENEYPREIKVAYGTNSISLAPFVAMDYGVGFGLAYEKIIGADRQIGIVLPLAVILERNSAGYRNGSKDYNAFYYMTPGFKIYPFGQSRATYAIGPTLMFSYGKGKDGRLGSYPAEGTDLSRLRLGAMISNYLNFQLTRSFCLGLEMGLGLRYLDREIFTGPTLAGPLNIEGPVKPTGRFALTLGYRF